VAYDAKGRIEVITDWNSGVDIDVERLNSCRGQLGAHQRRAGASHGVLAPMTMAEPIAAKSVPRHAGAASLASDDVVEGPRVSPSVAPRRPAPGGSGLEEAADDEATAEDNVLSSAALFCRLRPRPDRGKPWW
jgi:uncharacterized membrane protein